MSEPQFVPAPVQAPPAMSGDLFPPTMSVGEPKPAPTEPPPPAIPAAATSEKIVVGDKVFNSTQEALAYADGFVQSQKKAAATFVPAEPTPPTAPQKRPGQLIFEDPDQALADVENRAVERVRAEQRKIESDRKVWDDFYLKHPDLKGSELLVDAVFNRGKMLGEFNGMTIEQAIPVLGAKARQEVSKIRNVPSGGQALPSTPAMVAGASGASAPRVQAPQAPAPSDWVSELRQQRRRG